QVAIAEEFEGVAVERVGAGFDDGADGGRRVRALVRGQRIGFDLELLQCIRKWKGQVHGIERVVIKSAIERVIHAGKQTAADGNVQAAWHTRGSVNARRNRGAR